MILIRCIVCHKLGCIQCGEKCKHCLKLGKFRCKACIINCARCDRVICRDYTRSAVTCCGEIQLCSQCDHDSPIWSCCSNTICDVCLEYAEKCADCGYYTHTHRDAQRLGRNYTPCINLHLCEYVITTDEWFLYVSVVRYKCRLDERPIMRSQVCKIVAADDFSANTGAVWDLAAIELYKTDVPWYDIMYIIFNDTWQVYHNGIIRGLSAELSETLTISREAAIRMQNKVLWQYCGWVGEMAPILPIDVCRLICELFRRVYEWSADHRIIYSRQIIEDVPAI